MLHQRVQLVTQAGLLQNTKYLVSFSIDAKGGDLSGQTVQTPCLQHDMQTHT